MSCSRVGEGKGIMALEGVYGAVEMFCSLESIAINIINHATGQTKRSQIE